MPFVYAGIGVLVVWFTIAGLREGVVRRLVEVVGLVAVFLFASRLSGDLEPVLHENWGLPARAAFFGSWAVVIVGGVVGVHVLAKLSQRVARLTIAGWLDRAGGAVLGAVFGALLASCGLVLVLALPVEDDFKRALRDDAVARHVLHLAPAIYDFARSGWGGEGFFDMIDEHVEPAARKAADGIRATVESLESGDDGSD